LIDDDPQHRASITTLPRFIQADRFRFRLLLLMTFFTVLGLLLWMIAATSTNSMERVVLANTAAALLLLVAGLQSGYWVAPWRVAAFGPTESPGPRRSRRTPKTTESATNGIHFWKRWKRWKRLVSIGHRLSTFTRAKIGAQGVEVAWLIGLSAVALAIVRHFWDRTLSGEALSSFGIIGGSILGVMAFGLLVLERDFARFQASEWPEAIDFSRACRIVVATLMLSSIALLVDSPSSAWAPRVALLAGFLPMLLAMEWLLRAGISLFTSRRSTLEPELLAKSALGALITWPPPTLDALQHNLKQRFGIDLRQNWAFAFVRRASLPVAIGIAVVGWALTGVTELGADRRGVYEVFGRPHSVVGPGLHAGLPWPFSRMRSVENGVVHEIATTLPSDANQAPELSRAEDPAPASANRLWDASHVADKALLIASARNDKQGFQIVNMDVRFFYRIALTPAGAMNAVYKTADLPGLIQSTASRILVEVFASRTLDGVLGEERHALARTIGDALQRRLNDLDSGVEILATVVEAIHPPAGAANAYHSVQAAQITSEASISRERGQAAIDVNRAQQEAKSAEDQALAAARETLAAAQAVDFRFSAEREAFRTSGNAFLFEYYLSQLSQGLAHSQTTIVDHRIGNAGAPTIDLRRYGPAAFRP
jgi:regulator of protease activity HflC (stomatin/prohibitin superfamily)